MVADNSDERLTHTTALGAAGEQLAERRFEGSGRRRRGLRQLVRLPQPLPERVRGQVDAVDELLAPEADRERDDFDAERVDELAREVATAVRHDADGHLASSTAGGAG